MHLQTVLDVTDLRQLAIEAGATFGRSGSNRDASVCPLHPGADNPTAFHLYTGYDGRQPWHCFTRCPSGHNDGDAIAFYMHWRAVDFKTALDQLAHRASLPRPIPSTPRATTSNRQSRLAAAPAEFHWPTTARESATRNTQFSGRPRTGGVPHPTRNTSEPTPLWRTRARAFLRYARDQLWSPAGKPALDYLRLQRGLTDDTIRAWWLGYNPRDRWQSADTWGLPGGPRVWCPRGIVIPTPPGGVKVRRPLPGDPLAALIPPVRRLTHLKYNALRGSRATLFGAQHLAGHPLLLLAEGEFDALLAWQVARDLCDVASLGGARRRLASALAAPLSRAWVILAVYDADPAGVAGAASLRSWSSRVVTLSPPAHDLTAYWQEGGDLRAWIAAHVAAQMEPLLDRLDRVRHPHLHATWSQIHRRALTAGAKK